MSNIITAAEQLIGHTPLLRLVRLEAAHNLNCRLLAKLESFNPGGSAKDRVARAMLDDAEDRGLIGPGATIIEPTSGNTGIGLAAVCAQRGYRCIIVMPDSMSLERQKLMTAYGAELVLTPGSGGMLASITKARALAASIPGAWIPDQFANPANASAHYMTTGPEIWNDCDGEVDLFVAGVGTGGTTTGAGKYLREHESGVQVSAAEPKSSQDSGGPPPRHRRAIPLHLPLRLTIIPGSLSCRGFVFISPRLCRGRSQPVPGRNHNRDRTRWHPRRW